MNIENSVTKTVKGSMHRFSAIFTSVHFNFNRQYIQFIKFSVIQKSLLKKELSKQFGKMQISCAITLLINNQLGSTFQ